MLYKGIYKVSAINYLRHNGYCMHMISCIQYSLYAMKYAHDIVIITFVINIKLVLQSLNLIENLITLTGYYNEVHCNYNTKDNHSTLRSFCQPKFIDFRSLSLINSCPEQMYFNYNIINSFAWNLPLVDYYFRSMVNLYQQFRNQKIYICEFNDKTLINAQKFYTNGIFLLR